MVDNRFLIRTMTNYRDENGDMTENDTRAEDTERLDEKPRDVLRELVGILLDYQLDREPPISEEEMGKITGTDFAIDEVNYIIENGDVRSLNADTDEFTPKEAIEE